MKQRQTLLKERTVAELERLESYLWKRLARVMPSDTLEQRLLIDQHPSILKVYNLRMEVTCGCFGKKYENR